MLIKLSINQISRYLFEITITNIIKSKTKTRPNQNKSNVKGLNQEKAKEDSIKRKKKNGRLSLKTK
jgi:hypothetical protein